MSLNRFVGLGIFALSSSIMALVACDDSTTVQPAPNTAQGGSTTTTPSGNGGNSSSSTSTSSSAKGGSTGSTASGNGGTSTATSSTGSTSTGTCSSSTNLIADADKSEKHNWIGGDPASADDNPCGVQGSIYAYGDTGLDKTQFNADDSVQEPKADADSAAADDYLSPCASGKCCISGKTTAWPLVDGKADYTAKVWGGGIGISLGDPGGGGAKGPYAGSITGFAIKLSGSLGGQTVRIQYTQSADPNATAPYKELTKLPADPVSVEFSGVSCPSWATKDACSAVGANPYDLQVQVVGGDAAGDFNLCIESISPLGV
jgi:hypothetical protein